MKILFQSNLQIIRGRDKTRLSCNNDDFKGLNKFRVQSPSTKYTNKHKLEQPGQ